MCFFSHLQNAFTEMSVSKRDISYMPDNEDFLPHNHSHWEINIDNATLAMVLKKQNVLHRVARQIRKPGTGAGPVAGEGQIYNTSSAILISSAIIGPTLFL